MKKIIAAILCVAMLAVVLAGCGGSAPEEPDVPSVEDPGDIYETRPTYPPEGGAEFAAFAPDTVMITTEGGFTVTWDELYFQIRMGFWRFTMGGMVPDLTNELLVTSIMENAVDVVLAYRAVEYGARLHGVEFGAEELEMLAQMLTIEDEEGFMLELQEVGIYSMELYENMMRISFLAQMLFEELYGVDGSGLSDEAAAVLTEPDGYLMAMHTLIRREEGDEGEARAEAETILARLQNYTGDDFTAYFADLMFQYSADLGGLQSFPNGYLFQFGDMVPEFYEGTKALEIGGLSGLIETGFGYHIIHRLPIDFDEIPFSYVQQNQFITLRHSAAMMSFDLVLQNWVRDLNAQFSAEYDSINLAEIFE